MSDKVELFDDELDSVSGGKITYTWDGTVGTIGINGRNPFVLVDKQAFIDYYNANHETMLDATILTNLIKMGAVAKK